MRALFAACSLLACGRIGFHGTGDAAVGDVAGDGAAVRPNVAFVTAATFTGALGGLAGADALCNTAAAAASLPGTFVAFLSDGTTDAIARVAGSRGWVRLDGAILADTLAAGAITLFAPLDVDEHGAHASFDLTAAHSAWTGTTSFGTRATLTCSDWTSTGATGTSGAPDAAFAYLTAYNSWPCSTALRLYCFEVGKSVALHPTPDPQLRYAFVSSALITSGGAVAAFDTECQNEASAAALPGGYLAAVATSAQTIASRFEKTTAWQRVDGTRLSADGPGMFASDLLSFVNQEADGTYIDPNLAYAYMYSGAASPTTPGSTSTTCSDWTASSGGNYTNGFSFEASEGQFWNNGSIGPCGAGGASRVLCLQQ